MGVLIVICKNCGVKVPDGKTNCAVCGAPVAAAQNFQGSFLSAGNNLTPTTAIRTQPVDAEARKQVKSNRLILTTKGTNWMQLIFYLLSCIIIISMPIAYHLELNDSLSHYSDYARELFWEEKGGNVLLVYAIFFIPDIFIILELLNCRAYVNVYEDRMEGRGIQGFYHIMDFNLKYDKIVNVSREKACLFIHTSNGKYKIYTDFKTGKQIFDYFAERDSE